VRIVRADDAVAPPGRVRVVVEYAWHDSISDERLPELLRLFEGEWWTQGRAEADVVRMLERSDVVVAVSRVDGPLIGFARALTDGVYLAVVLDVIVAAEHRGNGAGALVVERLLAHPLIVGARSVELVCQPSLRGFYRRFGFTDDTGRSGLMRRTADPRLLGP
jgi:GNAT superfamily N-acetyltransferase